MPRSVSLDGHDPQFQQYSWSPETPPVARIRPGDSLRLRVPDSSSGQLGPSSTTSELSTLDLRRVDAAVGPVFVIGARPGDRLDVRLRRVRPGPWGWSGVFREFGMLRGRFDDSLQQWAVGATWARPRGGFLPPVSVPVRPMLGWVGVAPESGRHPMIPPRRTGGNLDHRGVREGAVLSLPVEVEGALLSIGDPHAAQGDGEVCGTGIETPADVELTVSLARGAAPTQPFLRSPDPADPSGPLVCALGVGPDLRANSIAALEGLLDRMVEAGLERRAAYLLASVAGHLRIAEAVDLPNLVVSAGFPQRLLDEATRHMGAGGSRRGGARAG